jgi:hypothetical protein
MCFLNDYCRNKQVATDWATAEVAMVFKKGDTADCGNYHPISLLSIPSFKIIIVFSYFFNVRSKKRRKTAESGGL